MTFLDYFSLIILLMGLLLAFYVFIYIHDIPYQVAKKRQHPHTEAIHVACWLSLFTLHAIWPIVFIWAIMKKSPFEFGTTSTGDDDLSRRLGDLERRLAAIESPRVADVKVGETPNA